MIPQIQSSHHQYPHYHNGYYEPTAISLPLPKTNGPIVNPEGFSLA